MRLRNAATALAITLGVGLISVAQAHYVKEFNWPYKSYDLCVQNGAEVSHGKYNLGYSWAQLKAYTYGLGQGNCKTSAPAYPAGDIAIKVHWDKWDGRAWQLCAYWDWRYNGGPANMASYSYHFDRLYCGAGYYRTYMGGYVWQSDREGWQGGWLGSDNEHDRGHYLPVGGRAINQLPPPGIGPLADDYPELGPPIGPPPTSDELGDLKLIESLAPNRKPDGFGPAAKGYQPSVR